MFSDGTKHFMGPTGGCNVSNLFDTGLGSASILTVCARIAG